MGALQEFSQEFGLKVSYAQTCLERFSTMYCWTWLLIYITRKIKCIMVIIKQLTLLCLFLKYFKNCKWVNTTSMQRFFLFRLCYHWLLSNFFLRINFYPLSKLFLCWFFPQCTIQIYYLYTWRQGSHMHHGYYWAINLYCCLFLTCFKNSK